MASLGKRLLRGVTAVIDGIPGEIGKLNTDGSYTAKVEGTLNEVYVRKYGDPLQTVTAIDLVTSRKARLPVRIRKNLSNRYVVLSVDEITADVSLGEAAASNNLPPMITESINAIWNSDQFKPGRIRALNGQDLQIIMEELPYPEKLLGGSDTITDLTTIVSTIGSGKKAWIVISVDPTDNSISTTKGTDANPTDELTWADAAAIAVTSGEIPLAAYVMQDGDTTLPIRPVEQDQYFYVDLRPWLTLGTSSGASPWQTTANVANLVTSTDAVTVGSATALGKLGVDGDADEIQLLVQGNATQTSPLITAEKSDGTDVFTVNNDGVVTTNQLVVPAITNYWRQPCRVVSNSNVSIASAPASIDSVTLASGDRVLLTAQSTGSQNGIWIFNGTGNAMTRPTDYVAGSTVWAYTNLVVWIVAGAVFASSKWRLSTTGTITIDTTSTGWAMLSVTVQSSIGLVFGGNLSFILGTGLSAARLFTLPDFNGTFILNEGAAVLNESSADVDIRFESNGDANNFFSDGGNDNVGMGTGTPDASAKMHVVSTTKGSIPIPVMTAAQRDAIASPAEGLMARASDTEETRVFDGQHWRGVETVGWLPFCYPLSFSPDATLGTALTLVANGGSIAIPMRLDGHMLLESVSVRNTDTGTQRTWGWDLYVQDLNNGNGAENTLRRVAACSANETFTPAGAASTRTLTAGSAPVYLPPGIYWLVIQCRHATNNIALASTAASTNFALNTAQTKTTTNPNGATLDFVAATWTKVTAMYAVRLNGRAFGETTAF